MENAVFRAFAGYPASLEADIFARTYALNHRTYMYMFKES